MALWPIVPVIIAAVFTHNLVSGTGAMDVIGSARSPPSAATAACSLLVACVLRWFYGGHGRFGTAVAIPAGMLAGLGFEAVPAVLICLLANGVIPNPTAPSASPRYPLPTWWVWIPAPGDRSAGAVGAFLCDDAAVYRTGCWSCCR